MIQIYLNLDDIIPVMASLSFKERKRVISRAHRKAKRTALVQINRTVRERLNVKLAAVKERVRISDFGKGSDTPVTRIRISTARVPFEHFNARETNAGVRVRVFKKGGTQFIKSAWKSDKSGRFFIREAAADNKARRFTSKAFDWKEPGKTRIRPIQRLMGPRFVSIVDRHKEKIMNRALEDGGREMQRQLNLVLGR